MHSLRSDLGEGLEDEEAFLHPRVRHLQTRFVNGLLVIEQQVQVNCARRVAVAWGAPPSQFALDRQQSFQQFARRKRGAQGRGAIEIARLPRRPAYSFSLDERRHALDRDVRPSAQAPQRFPECGFTVAEIGAQGNAGLVWQAWC